MSQEQECQVCVIFQGTVYGAGHWSSVRWEPSTPMSSMFVALKSEPCHGRSCLLRWYPCSALKAWKQQHNEINVTHTAMSAGAMVAGGLAFHTAWLLMLEPEAEVSTIALIVITWVESSLG